MSNDKLLSVLLLLLSVACAGKDAPTAAAAGSSPIDDATIGGMGPTNGGNDAGQSQSTGGTGSPTAGSAGAVGAGAGATGVAGGQAGVGGATSSAPSSLSAQPASLRWTAVRHYSGATPSGRTSGPAGGPLKKLTLHNGGDHELALTAALNGPGAAQFELLSSETLKIAAGADAELEIRLATEDASLGAAPAQDDGATVLDATLELKAGDQQLSVRNYALVLTYVELEPTFGQILRAFPEWTTKLPSWLPDDANPNPGKSLPGVVAGTDEVEAPSFERLDPTKPVNLVPIARFSPPGVVPFGWYEPGQPSNRTTVATLRNEPDVHTNDESRLLEPPLGGGSITFEPSATRFGVWMMPAGVGLLTSEDATCFDGQHRVRAWSLRDAQGVVIPGSFLLGAEEANNGDYQDYVFVLNNVKPSPG